VSEMRLEDDSHSREIRRMTDVYDEVVDSSSTTQNDITNVDTRATIAQQPYTRSQWRFYVGARGHSCPAPNLAQAPKFNSGQLDTVVLLLVDVIDSIVIRLAVVASQMIRGNPPIFFPRTAPTRSTAVRHSSTEF